MSARAFIDTNIFVYTIDRSEPKKRSLARRLLAEIDPDQLVISAQVLSEFYVVSTSKLEKPLAPKTAAKQVDHLATLTVVPTQTKLIQQAIALSQGKKLSYWDSLIVAAAQSADCSVIFTEDMSHGARFGKLTVENPFLA